MSRSRIYLDRKGKFTNRKPTPTAYMAPVGTVVSISFLRGEPPLPEAWQALPPMFRLLTGEKITPRVKLQADLIDWRRGGY